MSPSRPRILVIEDESPIRRFLRATLGAHGYEIEEATTAQEGLLKCAQHPPDLVLLDLSLPDGDGIDVARSLRTWTPLPIVVLSARGQESDKVAALDVGADDYLTKPFGVAELAARIRVALRHAAQRREPSASPLWHASEGGRTLRVDLARRLVSVGPTGGESEVRLTPTEFKLLGVLVRSAGKVLTHRQLLVEVWGPPHAGDVQYLRVYAGQLRNKLESDPAQPRFLLTEPGVGYRLVEGA
jgi:two-component system KDP operon response regulator KdpE